MHSFITNSQTKLLEDRLGELILNSAELKFLVGFFYFSGLNKLYESLKRNPNVVLKVLVGLNVANTIHGFIEHSIDKNCSDDDKRSHFLNSIKKTINAENFLIFIKYILCNRPKINT